MDRCRDRRPGRGRRRLRTLGVLVSGSGTNLQAILDGVADGTIPARVGLVLSNKAGVRALERARDAGVDTAVVDHRAHADREAFERVVDERLRDAGVDLVCLAGFMRVLTPWFVRRWEGSLLNIHPALLPAFPGTHGPGQALEYGVRFAGCTVHLVDEGTDTGPILVQAVVPVHPDDDEDTLAARILAEEHRIYPAAIRMVCEGRLEVRGRRVRVEGSSPPDGTLRNPET